MNKISHFFFVVGIMSHARPRVTTRTWKFVVKTKPEYKDRVEEYIRTKYHEFARQRKGATPIAEAVDDLKFNYVDMPMEGDLCVRECDMVLRHRTNIDHLGFLKMKQAAMRELSTRLIWPAPTPTVAPALA